MVVEETVPMDMSDMLLHQIVSIVLRDKQYKKKLHQYSWIQLDIV
jgi:hypothetical protein